MILLKTGSAGENINSGQLMDVRLPKIKRSQQQEIMWQVRSVEAEARELEEQVTNVLSVTGNRLLERLGMLASMPLADIDYYSRSGGLGRLDFEFNNPKYDIIDTVIANSKAEFVELIDAVDFLQDSDNPTERPDVDFLYADIGNVDMKWGELNSVVMKGRDATSSRMRRVIHEGNVLVSTTRPTRNAIAIVPKQLDKQICSTGFAVLKCKPTMNNRFLFYALRTWLSNLQFAKHCSGSGYPAINQETDLPHIRVPLLPVIDDQVKIADEVDDLLSKARKIEGESKNKHEVANTVFDKAVTEFA
jgi:type I restriction enzyme S subunit